MSNKSTMPHFRVIEHHSQPVLTAQSPGAEHVRQGFEGGRVIKQDGLYHLFTTELVGELLW